MKVVLVNGIYTRRSGDGVDQFQAPLEELGHQVYRFRYPITFVVTAWSREKQKRDGALLANFLFEHFGDEPVTVVGHSFGSVVIYRAMHDADVNFQNIWLFNAAIKEDYYWPTDAFDNLHCVYNPYDRALLLGANTVGRFGHVFGRMGRTGYRGRRSPKIHNHQDAERGGWPFINHGQAFSEKGRQRWAELIAAHGEENHHA